MIEGRFKLISSGGKSKIIDQKTGEDISHFVQKVQFEADGGCSILRFLVVDFAPVLEIETDGSGLSKESWRDMEPLL